VRFALGATGRVTVHFFDVMGNDVAEVTADLDPSLPGSPHSFSWDGRTRAGEIVPAGLYLYQVTLESDVGGKPTRTTGRIGVVR
jgi:flagellar hook assembly protein FlgD